MSPAATIVTEVGVRYGSPQSVPAGGTNSWRVMVLVRDTPFNVYANVAALPLANVNLAVPTTVRVTFAGSNGIALKAGPVVRISCPP